MPDTVVQLAPGEFGALWDSRDWFSDAELEALEDIPEPLRMQLANVHLQEKTLVGHRNVQGRMVTGARWIRT